MSLLLNRSLKRVLNFKKVNKAFNKPRFTRAYAVEANVAKITLAHGEKPGYVPFAFSGQQYNDFMETRLSLLSWKMRGVHGVPELLSESDTVLKVYGKDALQKIYGSANPKFDRTYLRNTVGLLRLAADLLKGDTEFSTEDCKQGWNLYTAFRNLPGNADSIYESDLHQSLAEHIAHREHILQAALGARWVLVKYVNAPIKVDSPYIDAQTKQFLQERFGKGLLKGFDKGEREAIWSTVKEDLVDLPEEAPQGTITMDDFFNRPDNLISQAKKDLYNFVQSSEVAEDYKHLDMEGLWAELSRIPTCEPEPVDNYTDAQVEEVNLTRIVALPKLYDGVVDLSFNAPTLVWFRAIAAAANQIAAGTAPAETFNIDDALKLKELQAGNPALKGLPPTPEALSKKLNADLEEQDKKLDQLVQDYYASLKEFR